MIGRGHGSVAKASLESAGSSGYHVRWEPGGQIPLSGFANSQGSGSFRVSLLHVLGGDIYNNFVGIKKKTNVPVPLTLSPSIVTIRKWLSTECSSRGPKFNSQHSTVTLYSQGIQCPHLASGAQTDVQTNTHTHKIKISKSVDELH